ncbi:hypothetical protein P7K49_021234, partial [Saguinus oedipus]
MLGSVLGVRNMAPEPQEGGRDSTLLVFGRGQTAGVQGDISQVPLATPAPESPAHSP